MIGTGTNGNGSPARSGTRALALLATRISGSVLRALSGGPKRLIDLRRECGSPAQTTLRAHLKDLEAIGAVEKRRESGFPGGIECALTPAGEDLLAVADAVDEWLRTSPEGPLPFDSPSATAAIKALIDGWSSTMLRAFAARPLSLTELDAVITGLSYPSLERRLAAMKLAGQIEACSGNGKRTPYSPTPWLRRAVAPLAVAARWERRHLPQESSPISRIDVEAAFLLALPLLQLPEELSGVCRLGVEMNSGEQRRLVGAMADARDGRLASCSVRLDSSAEAWATGSTGAWLHAIVDGDMDGVELGGDQRLARTMVEGLHQTLFGSAKKSVVS